MKRSAVVQMANNLVNELFIFCEDILSSILLKLFNQILSIGVLPATWCRCLVIPVYKKETLQTLVTTDRLR